MSRRLILCALLALGLTGCATLRNVGSAITGQTATLTVEVVGQAVDTVMKEAAKARHNGDITAAQWDTVAALHARYLPVYEAEKNAIEKNGAAGAPSASLMSLASQFYALAESFKKPSSTTATPAKP